MTSGGLTPTRVKRVVSDSAYYGLAAVVAKALALLTVPYLTRALSPDGFGAADLATSTAALLTLFAMFSGDIPAARSVGLTAVRREQQRALSSYVYGTALVSLLVAGSLLVVSPLIAGIFWGASDLAGLAALSMLLVPVSAIQAAIAQTLRIQRKARAFAGVSLVDLLAQLGLVVLLVSMGMGPAGVVIGFILGSTLGIVVSGAAARQTLSVRPSWGITRELISRGVPFLPYVTMFVVADWAMRSIVANSVGAVGVAEFGVALRIASVLALLSAAFAMAWGPLGLAKTQGVDSAREFGRTLTAFATVSIATAFVLGAVGPELVSIVTGPGYEGAALVLPGLALAYAVAGTEYILVIAAGISERASRVALASSSGAVVQILVALVLVPQFGIAVIGPTALLGRSVSFILLMAGVRRSIATPVRWLVVGASVVAVSFVALQLAVGLDPLFTVARWLFAAALALVIVVRGADRLRRVSSVDVA